MYRCQRTGKLVGPNIREHKVVTKKREVSYPKTIKYGPDKGQTEYIKGWEIVEEIRVAPEIYKELTGLEPVLTSGKQEKYGRYEDHIKDNDSSIRPWRPPRQRNRSDHRLAQKAKKGPIVEVIKKL